MPFVEIEFPLRENDAESMSEKLEALGALAVTFVDRGNEPLLEPAPGEVRMWRDTSVIALFDDVLPGEERIDRLARCLGAAALEGAIARRVEDRAWEREWLKDWKSMRFGQRLWICPVDAEPPPDPDAIVVRLDPGLAFGTGTHATTAQCLDVLDSLDLEGRRIIDYGCGSGILSLAALKLGAARALAVDIDPQALSAAEDNARRNGLAEVFSVQMAGAALRPADLVLANILAAPLIALAPVLSGACVGGGELVLSGILSAEEPELVRAYGPWFDIVEVRRREGWACLRLRRRAGGNPGEE